MNRLLEKERLISGGRRILKTAVTALAAVAIAVGLLVTACLLIKADVGATLRTFFLTPVQSSYEIGELILEMIPLLFTGTAVCIMNRCGQFNMFVEGGFFLGAFVAGVLAPMLPAQTPLIPLICMLAAALATGILGYIPAKMKASFGVNEFVASLMLNYIVFWVIMYLLHGVCGDPEYVNATRYLEDYMKLPFLNEGIQLSSSVLIALAVAILGGVFLFFTKWGYAIRTTGDNLRFAEYSGIQTKRTIVYSQIIGAMIAGFGGAALLLGNYYRFTWTSLPNYGFDGFVVAIIAGNNPFFLPFAALFLGYLRSGALQMSRLGALPNELIYIIQAIIIIVFGAKTFVTLKKRRRGGGRG